VVAHRRTADGDDHVRVLRLVEVRIQALARVSGDADKPGLGARRLDHGGHAQVIGGDDLPWPRPAAGGQQLVARRDDGDARAPPHRHTPVPHGGGERHLTRAEAPPGFEQHVTRAEIETLSRT